MGKSQFYSDGLAGVNGTKVWQELGRLRSIDKARVDLDLDLTLYPPTPEHIKTAFAQGMQAVKDQQEAVMGRKDDSGKVQLDLMEDLARAYKAVGEVLTWAVTKKQPQPYERGSWLNVSDFHNRYTGARNRHNTSVAINGRFATDPETGLLELAHSATNAMFLLEKALRDLESSTPPAQS